MLLSLSDDSLHIIFAQLPHATPMPSRARIEAIRDELLCDDIECDFDAMRDWSEARVQSWFENGGGPAPEPVLEVEQLDEEPTSQWWALTRARATVSGFLSLMDTATKKWLKKS